jgi:xylulokinase
MIKAALGIDLSTTAVKAGLVAGDGRLLAVDAVPYPSRYQGVIVEQDANAWWDAAVAAIRAVLARAPNVEVAGISVASQGITIVPVDAGGAPLRPALTWLDLRATVEAEALARARTVRGIFALAGRRPSAAYTLPKLMWMQAHEADIVRRAQHFLLPHDFLMARLTGAPSTDHTMAAGTLCYDLRAGAWSADLLGHAALDPARLAPIRWAASPAGALSADAALTTGVRAGTPVFVGGQDQKCAALAAGVAPGVVTVSLGTAAAIIGMTDAPVLDPAMRVPAFPHLFPGVWLLEGVVGTAGASLAWLQRMLDAAAAPDRWSFDAIAALAERAPAGARGVRFYPHLAGATAPLWRDSAAGTFTGVTLATTLEDCARAVLEGVAMQIRANVDVIAGITGRPAALRIFGGGAQSALWRRIIAAVTGVPVVHPGVTETALIGAAILAGVGAGLWPAPADAVAAVGRWFQATVDEADASVRAIYDRVYGEYTAAEARLFVSSSAD